MDFQNGYKVVYEIAKDGKRTFYAAKSTVYPSDADVELVSFNDADYKGKVIYEYKGNFYVSTGSIPAYDENGVPTDERIAGFDEVLKVKEEPVAPATEESPAEEPEVENELPSDEEESIEEPVE